MKKTLLLSALLIALVSLMKPQKAGAQISGVAVHGIDSLTSMCTIPSTDLLFFYGTLTGPVSSPADSLNIYINWDDGTTTNMIVPAYSSGTTGGSFNGFATHNYLMAGSYTPYIIASSTTSSASGFTVDPMFSLSNTCAVLSGKVYVDANHNCTADAGELGVAFLPVWVVNSTTADTTIGTWTDDTGAYSINLVPGSSYTIIADPSFFHWWYWWGGADSNLTPTCPSAGTYAITPVPSTTYTQNFADTCAPIDSFDIQANGWSGCMVPGDTTTVEVWAGNWWWYWDYTCESLSSTVTLTLDANLTYAGVMPWGIAPTSVSGSTITWNISTMADLFSFWSGIRVVCSTSATLGTTICNTVYVAPTSLPDPNLANNTASFCRVVTSSYDPNGKEVSPQGTGAPGYIDNKTPLSYNIHFQNTGTAPAANITIVDTISANLDMKSLHILNSSYPAEVFTSGNVVKFRFNGINLPDKTSNPAGSNGSISYAIMPKQGLAPLTPITNNASIYFDYNAPVVTNTTLVTIKPAARVNVQYVSNANFKASVYPNPASDKVFASTDDKSDFTVTMTDMLGRKVASEKSVNGSATLSTQSLPTGLYIVTLVNTKGNELTTKVTIQR